MRTTPFHFSMTTAPIPFTDYGGQDELLHFLHANGYPPDCYSPLFKLLNVDFHVIGMHQRPLWFEEKPERINDWLPLAQDFLKFISEGWTHPILAVGHSVGGTTILRAALHEPNRFRAVILIDPVLFPPRIITLWNLVRSLGLGRIMHPMIPGALRRRRRFDNLDLLFKGYRRRKVFQRFTDESLRAYIRGMTRPRDDGGYELVYSPEWEAHIYYTGVWRDHEIWQGLKDLQIPALFIRGAQSNTFWRDSAVKVHSLNPRIRVETIDNGSHLVPLERPNEVAELAISFSKESR